eukprot:TRINITY_DN9641_c0_g1_i1.p1 TRINITY_DN9641_c0_g1~~TRINITY_DN9641_c0_g1_i1.p1  ORF type:complete len:218 (+),score=34.83 TRINITY_DN9641_c0_g1_i1:475-1128(+)
MYHRYSLSMPLAQVGAYLDRWELEECCGEPTLFDALEAPEIPVGKYLAWLYKGFMCSEECLGLAVMYMRKSGVRVTACSVHRLLLGCLVLAVKNRDDVYYSDSHYARVGGVELREVSRIVRELLRLLDWELHVEYNDYNRFMKHTICAPTSPVPVSRRSSAISETHSSSSTESTYSGSSPGLTASTPPTPHRLLTPTVVMRRRSSITENILRLFCLA